MGDERGREAEGECVELLRIVSNERNQNNESQKLSFPGLEEINRTIVYIHLDLPWVFQPSENSRVKLIEKKDFLLKSQITDIRNGMLSQDEVVDNFIKAVMNNATAEIKSMLKNSSIVSDTLLKFRQNVNLKDDEEMKSVTCLEIFMDVFQFVVIQDKPEILKVMLEEVGERSQNELQTLLAETNGIRLNSIDGFGINKFEYEDVKLEKQGILHLAANGNNGCLKILLDRFKSIGSIDMPEDCQERSLMHIAASNHSYECLDTIYTFVQNKQDILKKDTMGFTPLHYAVKYGKLETVIFILTKLQNVDITEGDGINAQNNNGKTALFYAKDSHMMYLLLHYGADPCITRMISNSGHESVLEYYMKTNPENAIALLNFDVGTNIRDTTDDKFVYTYNFRLLAESRVQEESMGAICALTKFTEIQESSRKLLNSPIAEFYLRLKWFMSKKLYFLSLIIFGIYLVILTHSTFWTSYYKSHQNDTNNTGCYSGLYTSGDLYYGAFGNTWKVEHGLTSAGTLIFWFIEFFFMYQKGSAYFKAARNWFNLLILLPSSAYLILVALTGDYICIWEQYLGSLTLSLAWINMTLKVGMIPSVRIYIIMSYKVFRQLLTVFSFYSFIIFAFACAYTLILPQSEIFENLLTSTTKIIAMMIGEFEFQANFIWDSDNHKDQTNGATKVIIQVVFVAVMFIVNLTLNNLIIGLTVQNIGELQKEARIEMPHKILEQIRKTEDMFRKSFWVKLANGIVIFYHKLISIFESELHVLTPKDMDNSKGDFQLCVKQDFSKELHDSSYLMYSYFAVHLYDAEKKEKGMKIDIDIPEWIVKNTEKALDERKKIFNDLGEEFEKFRKAQRNSSELSGYSYNRSFQRAEPRAEAAPRRARICGGPGEFGEGANRHLNRRHSGDGGRREGGGGADAQARGGGWGGGRGRRSC